MPESVLPFVLLLTVAAVCRMIGILPRREFVGCAAFFLTAGILAACGIGVLLAAAWGVLAGLCVDVVGKYRSLIAFSRGSVVRGVVAASGERVCVIRTERGRYLAQIPNAAVFKCGEAVHVLITDGKHCDIIGPVK